MAGQVVDVEAPWAGGAIPIRVDVACSPIIFRFDVAFRPDFALGRKFFDFRPDFALGRNEGDRHRRFADDRRPDFALFSQKLKMHFSWNLKHLERFGA